MTTYLVSSNIIIYYIFISFHAHLERSQETTSTVDPELSVVAEEFDVANSNVQDMLDTLADLSAAAEKVANWLVPAEISEAGVAKMRQDLLYPESRVSKNVKRLSNVLQAQKAVYDNRIEENISTQPVLKALLGTDEDADLDEPWYPNPMIHKANLSTFLMIITRSWREHQIRRVQAPPVRL